MTTTGSKRFGKKRVPGCECTEHFTCRKCLDASMQTVPAVHATPTAPLRTFVWYANGRTIRAQGSHEQDAFTRMSKAKRDFAMHAVRHWEVITRYAITHINRDGMRTLTFANQGRNHYDTREEAQRVLDVFVKVGDLRAKVLLDMADTLEVRPVECYTHGDATGIYFDK